MPNKKKGSAKSNDFFYDSFEVEKTEKKQRNYYYDDEENEETDLEQLDYDEENDEESDKENIEDYDDFDEGLDFSDEDELDIDLNDNDIDYNDIESLIKIEKEEKFKNITGISKNEQKLNSAWNNLFTKASDLFSSASSEEGVIDYNTLLNKIEARDNNEIINEYSNNETKSRLESVYRNYVKKIRPYKVLPKTEQDALFRIYHDKTCSPEDRQRAFNLIELHNLRFVIKITKSFLNRGLSSEDLIQEGGKGLIKAIEKFDVDQGYRFSTYAVWWIKQTTQRAVQNDSRTVRVPIHIIELISKIKKFQDSYKIKNGIEPTNEEIAEFLNNDPSIKKKIDKRKKPVYYTASNVEKILKNSEPISSLDEEYKNHDGDSLKKEAFVASSSPTPEEFTNEKVLHETLINIMRKTLTDLEFEVIYNKFGLANGKEYDITDICKKYNITQKQYNALISTAMRKLRNSSEFKQLNIFLT